jgi:hypothetical protein
MLLRTHLDVLLRRWFPLVEVSSPTTTTLKRIYITNKFKTCYLRRRKFTRRNYKISLLEEGRPL